MPSSPFFTCFSEAFSKFCTYPIFSGLPALVVAVAVGFTKAKGYGTVT